MSAEANPVDLTGKVALVTGATGGMGREITLELARRGATVVTIARDARRATDVAEAVAEVAGPGRFQIIEGDLTRRADVHAAAERIAANHPALNLLINNAGAHFAQHQLSADGVELHVALNHLAGFGLTALLTEPLVRGGARVVLVASDTINDTRQVKLPGRARPATLDPSQLDDVRALNPAAGFVPFEAYARAKLLAVMAGYEFADRLGDRGVTVNSVHPGIVATDIVDDLIPPGLAPFRGLIRRSMLSPVDGATAALRLATHPVLAGVTGRYFRRDTEASTPAISYDHATRARIWSAAERHYGLSA